MTMALSSLGLQLRAAQASCAGRKPENEDALGIRLPAEAQRLGKGAVLAIADGVSGSGDGRRAAEVSVQGFLADYFSTPETWSVKTSGERVINAINRWLHGQGQQYTQTHLGLLTTFSALVLRSQSAFIFHVGDSRVQRLRSDERGKYTLEQLSQDHATRVGAEKTYLTRALGMDQKIDIDFRETDVQVGDVFFLSTDGIHEFIPRPLLKKMLEQAASDPDACCRAIIDTALKQGSDDNLSCQILVVDALPPADAEDSRLHAAHLPLLPDLVPGQHIDGLRVEAELHANARSQLYRVRDEKTGELFVLKTPSRLLEDDPVQLTRFAREDWLGQRLDQKHIIKGVAPRQTRKSLYLLQQWLDGESLAQWMHKNPQPPAQVIAGFAEQAIKGLRALHRRETLHQDIKPDNLFLCRDGTLKLIDLGSVHVASMQAGRSDAAGAMEYAAPEYRLHLPPDTRSEQFSLALSLYELLTGRHPFGEAYLRASTLAEFQRLPYDSACRHNPHVPLWFDAALKKALSIVPAQRYDSLGEFLLDLQKPNPELSPVQAQAWLEKNPAGFWKVWALLATLLAFIELLVLLARQHPH